MLDWEAIDTVLLDMDGTLLDLHYDNHFWLEHLPGHHARRNNISFEAAQQEILKRTEAEKGTLNWYCLDFWGRELDMDIPSLKRETAHKIRFRPSAEKFLQQLHRSPRRVILATNAHRAVLDLKLEMIHFEPYFDRLVSAHDLGVPKEDPAFWDKLQEIEPFDPERTVFIDDSEAVLASARRYGIRHLLAIYQPDSQRAGRSVADFHSLTHFDDILPEPPESP